MRAARAEELKGSSPWDTLQQSLLRLGEVVPRMQPTWHAESIAELTPAFFEHHRLRAAIWDVDGTLMSHHGSEVAPSIAPAFWKLVEAPRLRHVILSNAPTSRFAQLGRLFPDIPILRLYRLNADVVPQRLHRGASSLSQGDLDALRVAGAVVLRKPNAALVEFALQELQCGASEALTIGDQLTTDVAGARMAHVRALKVATIAPDSFPFTVRSAQRLERVVYALRYGLRRSQCGGVSTPMDQAIARNGRSQT